MKIREWVAWAVKIITVVQTAPVTMHQIKQADGGLFAQVSGMLLIEGVFLYLWIGIDNRTGRPKEQQIAEAIMLWIMAFVILTIGAATGSIVLTATRIAAVLAIAQSTWQIPSSWLSTARSKTGWDNKRSRALRRAGLKQFRRLVWQKPSPLEAIEQARLQAMLRGDKSAPSTSKQKEQIVCEHCGREFKSPQALAGHQPGVSKSCLERAARARVDGKQREEVKA